MQRKKSELNEKLGINDVNAIMLLNCTDVDNTMKHFSFLHQNWLHILSNEQTTPVEIENIVVENECRLL